MASLVVGGTQMEIRRLAKGVLLPLVFMNLIESHGDSSSLDTEVSFWSTETNIPIAASVSQQSIAAEFTLSVVLTDLVW